MQEQGKQLITIGELAEMLSVGKDYIYRLNYEGKIPGMVRLGRKTVRYRKTAIEEWINNLTIGANGAKEE